jgi:bacterial/archaeal transporter family-2 protein
MSWTGTLLFGALVAVAGAGLVVQSACNARLRKTLGSPLVAVFVSLVVSMASILAAYFASGGGGGFHHLGEAPWYAWLGGPLGPIYLVISLAVLPRIGAGLLVAAIVFGQMLIGVLMDSFGWLGMHVSPITPWKILGVLCILAGVALFQNPEKKRRE